MPSSSFWEPGTPVVLRGAGFGQIWWALSVTVVQDTPDLLALYWSAGAVGKNTDGKPAPQAVLSPEKVELFDWTWTETDVVYLTIPGAGHAIYIMRETGQTKLRCWYVNLQTPLRRFSAGFEAMDQFIDVVVSPDRSEWRWKDEDEFNIGVSLDIFSADEAKSIRREGERAVSLLKSGHSVYIGWQNWTAPTTWEIPKLPSNWDSLE
jgi:uncharacterized protein